MFPLYLQNTLRTARNTVLITIGSRFTAAHWYPTLPVNPTTTNDGCTTCCRHHIYNPAS